MKDKRTIFVGLFQYKDKEYILHYDFGVGYPKEAAEFMFLRGNYCCDCNRSLFIRCEYGEDAIPELDCGKDIKLKEYHIEYWESEKAASEMPRYIDLDKAIERLKASPAFPNFGTDGYFLLDVVEDLLKQQPTADVVPRAEVDVVRCKDCKYWQDNNDGYPHEECRWWKNETPDADDYCSYGVSMKDGGW